MERALDKPDGANSGTDDLNGAEPFGRGDLNSSDAGDVLRTKEAPEPHSIVRTKGVRGPYKKAKKVEEGGYGYLYGNLYEQAQARRQKILGFLQKDLFQIGRPDLRRFMNINHAYECLLPYHIFGFDLYEDMLFMSCKEVSGALDLVGEMTELMKEVGALEGRPVATEETLVCELLLYYQQRYISTMYGDGKKQRIQRRYRQQLSKRNTIFRLKIGIRAQRENDVNVRNGRLYFKRCGGST
ncbi:hypothetical protein KMI_01g01620 [Encephalitozoon hellem]|nr:hypothetical protein KMI_01g01620 [Encephalitozoon hellem]